MHLYDTVNCHKLFKTMLKILCCWFLLTIIIHVIAISKSDNDQQITKQVILRRTSLCLKIFYDGDTFYQIYCNNTIIFPNNTIVSFEITTDRNDTIKYGGGSDSSYPYDLKESTSDHFIDLGNLKQLEDCYSLEEDTSGKKMSCEKYFKATYCYGYKQGKINIMTDCWMLIEEREEERFDGGPWISEQQNRFFYFCTMCVKDKLPTRQ